MVQKGTKVQWDLQLEESLQAVIIADSFSNNFGPLTSDTPKCLLTLVDRPILDFTLECLRNAGIEDIILYCTKNVKKMKEYVSGKSDITPIFNEDCLSFGDAMRDLDGKSLLRQSFVLMSGDTVANIHLLPIYLQHKKRCSEDKNNVMTLVFKRIKPGHHVRSQEEEVVLALREEDKRILHYVKGPQKTIDFPLVDLLDSSEAFEISYDLIDPGIAICSPAIPPLFSDHFDCQTLEGFIKAKASNLKTYLALSQDVLNRWLYPIVPDFHSYSYLRHNIYRGVVIGQNSTLTRCCIGNGVEIGKNVVMVNTIIHENAVIGDNCDFNGCVVGAGSHKMSLYLREHFYLIRPLMMTFLMMRGTDKKESSKFGFKAFILGLTEDDSETEDEQKIGDMWGLSLISDEDVSDSSSDEDSVESEFLDDQDDNFLNEDEYNFELFKSEVLESLTRGAEEGIKSDNLILEINSSKHAYNISLGQVNQCIVNSILDLNLDSELNGPKLLALIKKTFTSFRTILEKYIKSPTSQLDCLKTLETFTLEHDKEYLPIVTKIVHFFYEEDIASSDAIFSWYKTIKDDNLKKKMIPLISWLEENRL
ncbi:EIF2B5 [Lepeophtheirus salmonis]|uniref:Translation initiation factor eIF2B subunit epsilon n=1 Tax=Lepeophtheirus salmonis TaxID=72036 RepID=A0A7R8D415_LEPSM|nr:EIF2B5 [Lepeophtheirus salmonis]CAF3021660.1 EIF2B5 [Lepeophtheirus salmonis]